MTNLEKIQSMSKDEFVELWKKISHNDCCPGNAKNINCILLSCDECIRGWLDEESKE